MTAMELIVKDLETALSGVTAKFKTDISAIRGNSRPRTQSRI